MMTIAFVSGMGGVAWGGSEILWSQSAVILAQTGHKVMASVRAWPQTPQPLVEMRRLGIEIEERKMEFQDRLVKIGLRLGQKFGFERPSPMLSKSFARIKRFAPDLVCISHGSYSCGLEWMEWCLKQGIPYVSLSQANAESIWPVDALADQLAVAHAGARMSCFVSKANLTLFEQQIGMHLPNARVVWNPFQVRAEAPLPWPDSHGELRLACVGRLDPRAKGQDLILQVMALPKWRDRALTVSLFGDGPMKRSLQRLAQMCNLEGKVDFPGHVAPVEAIWDNHHALLLPSRFEGLPLAVIEAMRCGRPAIVTDIAGNKEVIENNVTGFIAAAPSVMLLDEALERAWQRRDEWENMGKSASVTVRRLVPADPAREFADLLTAEITHSI